MMIFDAIMSVIVALLTGVFALIPAYTLPSSVTDVGAGVGASLAGLNSIFPATTLGAMILVVLGVKSFLLLWAGLVWLYGKIPGKFT